MKDDRSVPVAVAEILNQRHNFDCATKSDNGIAFGLGFTVVEYVVL